MIDPTSLVPAHESSRSLLDKYNVTLEGLPQKDIEKRREAYGENKLREVKRTSSLVLFLRQFQSPLIYVLLIAAVIVFVIGHKVDGLVIFSVLFINALLGMFQEGKAEDTIKALREFTKTETRVRRGGKEVVVLDTEIVLGDIILLSEGDKIPADARVIAENIFKVDEAALTGESEPVQKISQAIVGDNLGTNEMKNMVFKGTYAVSGTAECLVTAVGMNTVIGSLSQKLSNITSEVPLKKNIERIAKGVTIIISVISVVIFFAGLGLGYTAAEMFLTSVAIAVSVIPEGLPIVITLVLATGVYRMGKQNALVKKLQAVEALGRADVICVDKTGTITKNELMISSVFVSGNVYSISGSGYETAGEATLDDTEVDVQNHDDLLFMGRIAAYCANATVSFREKEGVWKVIGDPTEASLRVFGEKMGFKKESLEKEHLQILDIPFSHEHTYHGTIHKTPEGNTLTIVGAPEMVIEMSEYILEKGRTRKITGDDKDRFMKELHTMATKGLRVLACSVNEKVGDTVSTDSLSPLTLVGLYGLSDTLRDGVAESVGLAKAQGIQVALITGDYKKTAQSLAQMAGIYTEGDDIITGKELNTLSDEELLSRLSKTTVFARVSPEDKLRIVSLYKSRGDIVAMTGDGVNDALSLVAADLGVAMGKIGTEVTKEAADIVLLDDNFKSIVSAIEEGRSIFSTIKKVLLYMFSTGFGELFTIVIALFLLMPLPLLPSQIIWLNLVTDSFLVIAFAFEPKQKLGKTKADRNKLKILIDAVTIERIIMMGLVMSLGTLYLFNYYNTFWDLDTARTVALTLLAVYQWVNVWNCRSETTSVFSQNPFSNLYFIYALGIVSVLHIALLYTPFMQKVFSTVPLGIEEWLVVALFALPLVAIEEIRKHIHALFARFR